MRTRRVTGKAAGALAAFFLSGALAGVAPASPPAGGPACRIEPRVLDVQRPAGALVVRIELPARGRGAADGGPEVLPGVHLSSVGGTPLPRPSPETEGIGERPAARSREDLWDGTRRVPVPNGIAEMVVRFDRPADGDPATTADGDAGDVLAMLMDVPDGTQAEICVSGETASGPFTCCDTVTVRNRGLRDLPAGPFPEGP